MITSILLDEGYDIATEVNDGVRTIIMGCNHRVISNLVILRLQTLIDWELFIENADIDLSLLAQQVRAIVRGTYGVTDVDLSEFNPVRNGRSIDYGTICFTVDCDNSIECFTI